MNSVNVSGIVMGISELYTVDGVMQCCIELSVKELDTLYISCAGQLAKNIKSQIFESYDVIVIGKLGNVFTLDDGKKKNLGIGIIASAIVCDDEVYPSDYPKQVALDEVEKTMQRENIAKALENLGDDEEAMF